MRKWFSRLFALVLVFALTGMARRPQGPVVFPRGFLWGASSAAYQVEGGLTNNDWYEWEVEKKNVDPTGRATDFWNRYGEDLGIARDLRHNAFRMSVEWSRLEPEPGRWDESAFDHYRAILRDARARGLRTFVTLHHFTTPLWLTRKEGWLNPEAPLRFGEFTARVVEELGGDIDYWITLNEPNVRMLTGYIVGLAPPGEQDFHRGVRMLAGLLKAHARAYREIHARIPGARVGFAHHMRDMQPARRWNPLDVLITGVINDFWNKQILDAMMSGRIFLQVPFLVHHDEEVPELAGTLDFVGVNYYTRDKIRFNSSAPTFFDLVPAPADQSTEMGMEIYPRGFYRALALAGSYGKPVYVTENGIADAGDLKRGRYICDHLKQLGFAIQDGVDVRGYLHWSLTDNWEWVYGFGPRMGLVEIDYSTLARKVRPSAYLYRDVIAAGSTAPCDAQPQSN